MPDDDGSQDGPTRRDYMKYGGVVLGGGAFAGCSSDATDSTSTATAAGTEAGTPTETDTPTETATSTETSTPDDASHSVTMAPAGTVEFDAVPRNILASSTSNIDIAAALGHGTAVKSTSRPSSSVPSLEFYHSKLDTSDDWIDFREAGGYSKETLYELESDVHFLDPAYVSTLDGWSRSDIEEVAENVGPFLGNMYSRKHRQPPESWRDSYQYYTLWDLTEKYAEALQERERFERLSELRETLLDRVRSELPSPDDRPTVGMVYPRLSEDAFYVHRLNQPGYFFAHTRPLDAVDVFADIETGEYGGKLVDYEAMIEADPDVIIMNHGISAYYDVADAKQSIRDHGVGSRLSAVRNGRLYASGNPRQGPVMNLFQLEMTAKQFYPEQFGEWPGYVDGEPYPEIAREEQLFDRQVVADVVTGDI